MNKFLLHFLFLFGCLLPLRLFPAVGFFSQTVDFDYQLVEENIYYHDGFLKTELSNTSISAQYGMNYLVKFKSGYHHDFFAVMLEYVLSIETEKLYNQIDVNIENLNQKVLNHQISPMAFFQWLPFRLGLGYHFDIRKPEIVNKQRLSIRPENSLSLYFHVYFPELWYRSPIGLGTFYEIAFDPSHPIGEIKNHLFQSAGLNFSINFNYLSQFQIFFTYQRLDEKLTLYKGDIDSVASPVYKEHLIRYYVDYVFIHQIIKELALRVGIANLVYSDFESPTLHFNIGITYSFFRI